jgi:hypothetical protein
MLSVSKGVVYEKDKAFQTIAEFAAMLDMMSANPITLDEQVDYVVVRQDDSLAWVYTPYRFYVDGKLNHCGVNLFTLVQHQSKWMIVSIADTERKHLCEEKAPDHRKAVNVLLDNWHKAAAQANFNSYFNAMADDGYYLGTDGTERWTKKQFIGFAKPFFDKGKAWSFTAYDRFVYFNDEQNICWFEERLDTWMGECRGSGVLALTEDGWKIKQYNLTIAVPNDAVKPYLKMMQELTTVPRN